MDIQEINDLSKTDLFWLGLRIAGETFTSRGRNFIYVPRGYDSNPEYEKWKTSVEIIPYEVSGLKMNAFLDCDPENIPERTWLMFGGNASVALDWLPVTSFAPPSSDAFLFFEYPGFGECEGSPSRKLINLCIDQIILHLIDRFSIEATKLGDHFQVIGHSLGCAIALESAFRYSIPQGILLSPFTSIRKMAQQMFWKPLSYLAADPYDNMEALRKISGIISEPEFHIVHGSDDTVIPIEMAKDLHATAPDSTKLWEIEGAEHNDILLLLARELGAALTNGGEFTYAPDP